MEAGEDITQKILGATGWREPELERELERKQEQFAGLLTREGALELVAREKGLEVGRKTAERNLVQLAQVASAGQPAGVRARVWHVFATKKFVKKTPEGSRAGKVRNVLLKDASGEATLVLWGRDADWVDSAGLKRNDVIEVSGAVAKKGLMGLELHSNLSTRLSCAGNSEELPLYAKRLYAFSELSPGMYDVDAAGKVAGVGRQTEFQRVKKNGELETGSVSDCVLEEGGKRIRLVAWDSNAQLLATVGVGDEVVVEGANSKQGREDGGTELHAGWASHLILKKTGAPAAAEAKTISELVEGAEAFVNVRVSSVSNAWALLKCSSCGSKTPLAAGREMACECGGQRKKLFVARAVVSDASGSLECVFFNQQALGLMELNAVPLDASAILELKKEEVVGREFGLLLKVKKSEYSNSLEAVATAVGPPTRTS